MQAKSPDLGRIPENMQNNDLDDISVVRKTGISTVQTKGISRTMTNGSVRRLSVVCREIGKV